MLYSESVVLLNNDNVLVYAPALELGVNLTTSWTLSSDDRKNGISGSVTLNWLESLPEKEASSTTRVQSPLLRTPACLRCIPSRRRMK
jgi:hypothetical protein